MAGLQRSRQPTASSKRHSAHRRGGREKRDDRRNAAWQAPATAPTACHPNASALPTKLAAAPPPTVQQQQGRLRRGHLRPGRALAQAALNQLQRRSVVPLAQQLSGLVRCRHRQAQPNDAAPRNRHAAAATRRAAVALCCRGVQRLAGQRAQGGAKLQPLHLAAALPVKHMNARLADHQQEGARGSQGTRRGPQALQRQRAAHRVAGGVDNDASGALGGGGGREAGRGGLEEQRPARSSDEAAAG